MCIYSVVSDHFNPIIPYDWNPSRRWGKTEPGPIAAPFQIVIPPDVAQADLDALREEVAALRELVTNFLEAKAAAERLDVIIQQRHCVDPEKAKLEATVVNLQRRLRAAQEALGV